MKAFSSIAAALVLLSSAAWANQSGHKWFSVPVKYKVYAHSNINGMAAGTFSTQVLPKVKVAFAHWTAPEVTCTSWASSYLSSFTLPGGPTVAAIAIDSSNQVLWLSGSNWQYGSNALGITVTSWLQYTGEIIDADMQLNNNVAWKLGGTGTAYDVESVVTHEAGHFLGLDHTTSTTAIMSPSIDPGQIRITLGSSDIQDVCGAYPKIVSSGGTTDAGTVTGTVAQGLDCSVDSECVSGLVCRGASTGGGKICTKACTTQANCPYPYTCQTANIAQACLAPIGDEDLCDFCVDGSDCISGICITDGRHNWCSNTCTVGKAATTCGNGYDCTDVAALGYAVCQPSGPSCPAPQCTTAAQCPVGYSCTNSMCEATGNTGDRCEVSLYCANCDVCVGSSSQAFCLRCCAPQTGGYCDSCPVVSSCGGIETCTALVDNNGNPLASKVCVPSGGNTCELCASDSDCLAGLSCVNGTCHTPCNPGAPNSCLYGTCTPTFNGKPAGVCACATEIASLGQSCGSTSTQLKACSTGAICIGSPAYCRAPCNPTYSGSCPSGQACETVNGQNVCLPTNISGTRCNQCNNGACGSGMTCSGGRCYTTCDLSASSTCDGCTDVGGTSDVCACDDEQAAPGSFCGVKDGHPAVCGSNSICVDSICRLPCSASGTCTGAYTCASYNGSSVCIPRGSLLSGPDGGTGSVSTSGCACNSLSGGPAVLLSMGLILHWSRRRAKSVSNT